MNDMIQFVRPAGCPGCSQPIRSNEDAAYRGVCEDCWAEATYWQRDRSWEAHPGAENFRRVSAEPSL